MNKSKRPNPSNLEIGVDFISDMPDPVLELILQGLPNTEEVVRTSVLSKRWRYLWTCIPQFPSLDLDCDRLPNPSSVFPKKFVVWALADKTVVLDRFRLCCARYYKKSTVKKWIKAAVDRKIKSLDLIFNPGDPSNGCPYVVEDDLILQLPDCLIMCESLESLRLFMCKHPLSLPTCTGFVALKVLELNSVYLFQHNSLGDFLKHCPVLEELSLIDCLALNLYPVCVSSTKLRTLIIRNWETIFDENKRNSRRGLKVSCPKLVNFEFVGRRCLLILEDVHSLKKAAIHPEELPQKNKLPAFGKSISEWLAGISHVDSLSCNLYFLQCMDAAHDPIKDFSVSLPNLKNLEIFTTIDAFTLKVIIEIIRHSPVLESLNLIIQEESLTTDYWELDQVETREILTCHLKRVEFLEFGGEEHKLVIALWLLDYANALEEMVFGWSNEVKYHEKSTETLNHVSKVNKASSTVKLITLLKH